jgi:hypothetical protein
MRYAFLTFAVLSACDSPVDNGVTGVDMRGMWSYSGIQAAPALTLAGTLNIDQQNGRDFSGTVAFSETDVQGTQTNRTGQLSGRVVGTEAVDFDIFFDEGPRRHVATIRGDSMSGIWARTGSVPPVTGSYMSKKLP